VKDSIGVGIAEMRVGDAPLVLRAYGLGSCLGVTLYDAERRLGGLAHTLLPSSRQEKEAAVSTRFVDSAIHLMIEELVRCGASREGLGAKLAGGATMFPPAQGQLADMVGPRNTQAAREILRELNIPLLAEDTGGNFGRTISFDLATGDVTVHSFSGGARMIVI
jgi:chemotaxis protein CheD